MSHPAAKARYVQLTTFRKNGDPVGTPVWIAPAADDLVVITLADSWKVRRLRNDPRVEVRECDVRGRVNPDSATYEGTGRVSDEPNELTRVRDAMNRKYALARLGNTMELLLGRWMGRKQRVGIFLTLAAEPKV